MPLPAWQFDQALAELAAAADIALRESGVRVDVEPWPRGDAPVPSAHVRLPEGPVGLTGGEFRGSGDLEAVFGLVVLLSMGSEEQAWRRAAELMSNGPDRFAGRLYARRDLLGDYRIGGIVAGPPNPVTVGDVPALAVPFQITILR